MIGERLSHYRITAKLGAGGMGEVYLAEDTKLERKVALKVLPAELADDPDRLKRLQREARALAALDHPNIVTVFSVEEDEGLHFLTMAHVEGEGLDELIPEEGFSVERLLELAVPLADALRAAHERGVIHRDLKPGNIMIDRENRLRVLDFGLARVEAAAGPEDVTQLATQTMTQAGTVLGTYPYMSPEQAQGQIADARSDLFSLGVILYEMATGQRPFTGETGVSLISSILKDAPTPVTDIKAGVPEELGAIIEHCLEKDPAERFASAEELRERLEALRRQVRAGEAVVSATSRQRRFTLLAALVAVAVLGGVWGWVNVWREPEVPVSEASGPRIASLAVLPLKNFSGDADQQYFADGMTEALITDLSKIGALKVISRTSAMRYRDTEKSLAEIAGELDVEAVIEGSVLREGERVGITAQLIEVATDQTLWADRYERDLTSILALQGEIARAIAGEIQVTLTPEEETLLTDTREVDPEAHEAYLKAKFHLSKYTPADLQSAFEYLQVALEHDPESALVHAGVASLWISRRQMGLTPAREATHLAKAAAERAIALDSELAEAHNALCGAVAWGEWDWQAAESSKLRALALNPNNAGFRAGYSHILMVNRRWEEAEAQIERAVELDPLNEMVRAFYGMFLHLSRRPEEAIVQFQAVLETVPNHVLAHSGLWQAFRANGQNDEAVLAAQAFFRAKDDTDLAEILSRGYADGGYVLAMSRAARAMEQRSQTGFVPPVTAFRLYVSAGDKENALKWMERAYEAGGTNLPYIGIIPGCDFLRDEPQFQDLLRRMNLPA